jgi:hypothetical protein
VLLKSRNQQAGQESASLTASCSPPRTRALQKACRSHRHPTRPQQTVADSSPNHGLTSKARTAQKRVCNRCSSFVSPPFVTPPSLKRQFSTSFHPLPAAPCCGLLTSCTRCCCTRCCVPLFVEPIHARLPEVDVVVVWRVRLHSLVRVASLWRSTCVCT